MIADEAQAREYVEKLTNSDGIARLERFGTLLAEENTRQNLVAAASLAQMWQRHFADSAQLLTHVSRETRSSLEKEGVWLDLGTGAGFPGLLVSLMRPNWNIRLVESRRRRVEWLQRCVEELGLTRCEVEGSTLQQVEAFEARVISARAFAPLPKLLSLSARFSTQDTLWVLPKGQRAAQELAELPRRFAKAFHVEQSVTDDTSGVIVGHLLEKPSNERSSG